MARYHTVLGTGRVPDALLRAIIRRRLRDELERLEAAAGDDAAALRSYAAALSAGPLAIHQEAANRQHYELPTAFFTRVPGAAAQVQLLPVAARRSTTWRPPRRRCWRSPASAPASRTAWSVLDLGCGWGSLALFIAERYPRCRVTAMSNSRTPGEHIAAAGARRRHRRRHAASPPTSRPSTRAGASTASSRSRCSSTCATTASSSPGCAAGCEPDGRVFVHVFSHARFAYTFSADDPRDWMGSRFFSGGQMPAHDLFLAVRRRPRRGGALVAGAASTTRARSRTGCGATTSAPRPSGRSWPRPTARGRRGLVGRLAALLPRLRRDVRVRRRAGMGRVTLPARAAVSGRPPHGATRGETGGRPLMHDGPRRVVVTGMGIVCPLGNDVETSWRRLVAGESGIATITRFDASRVDSRIAGEVKGFDPADFIDRRAARRMDAYSQYAVAAARQAVERRRARRRRRGRGHRRRRRQRRRRAQDVRRPAVARALRARPAAPSARSSRR